MIYKLSGDIFQVVNQYDIDYITWEHNRMTFLKSDYFVYRRKSRDRQGIKDRWIEHVIEVPEKVERQSDGRIRKWAWIDEEGKLLRVVLLEDGITVHNAFYDRTFKRAK